MAKNYRNKNLSFDQLDELFEKDRIAAAAVAETVMLQEISTAISNITEINQIANARIQADSAVASAKIAADAEVCATELAAKAEMTILQIQSTTSEQQLDPELLTSMITEVGHHASEEISTGAEQTIAAIKRQAEAAIGQISSHAKNSINDIKSLADDYAKRVRENAEIARRKLLQEKEAGHTESEAQEDADEAAKTVLDFSLKTIETLHNKVSAAVKEIDALTTMVLEEISNSVSSAEARIYEARDRALASIKDLLDFRVE